MITEEKRNPTALRDSKLHFSWDALKGSQTQLAGYCLCLFHFLSPLMFHSGPLRISVHNNRIAGVVTFLLT